MDEKNSDNPDLDPEVIKVRDKIISKIGDKPLDEVNSIIKKLLNESMDDITRLGALAARLKIIRSKIELLYERKVEINPKKNLKVTPEKKLDDIKSSKKEEKWIRIKMLAAGDVNGKQIDKGVILDVKEDDSKKLLETKKAEIVEESMEGASPIQKSDNEENTKNNEVDGKNKGNDNENKEKNATKSDETQIKEESALKQDIKEEKKSESEIDVLEKDSKEKDKKEDRKSKNLLEKHEDAVYDDDKNQELTKKAVSKSDEDKSQENKDIPEKTQKESEKQIKSNDESEKKKEEGQTNLVAEKVENENS